MSDEPQPTMCPGVVRATRTHGGKLYLGGVGKRQGARIMFVTPAALEEELSDIRRESYGREVKVKPSHLKGPAGAMFHDIALSCGIDLAECFYTSICRWMLPRARRTKPSKEDFSEGRAALQLDIREVKPSIIVCLGKPAFDQFVDIKVKLSDVAGGWFWSDTHGCLVYPMEPITKLVSNPELIERFKIDLREIRRMLDKLEGKLPEDPIEEDYRVVSNMTELQDLVELLVEGQHRLLSVDCEWHGHNHIDGMLRSLQICWAPGKAAYIRFMDDGLHYVFGGGTYREAGQVLATWLDHDDVQYVGHHISADLPWMHHVLGLKWYGKSFLDTEFAQQTEDEHAELGLERLGMTYTDMGRYDLELTLWCKKNAKLIQDGYGLVPDEILIPYGMKDVDVVMRSWPGILRRLVAQGLDEYYFNIFNPFVTDVFTNFALQGLPINDTQLDELRDLYHYARAKLHKRLLEGVKDEAKALMLDYCLSYGAEGIEGYSTIMEQLEAGNQEDAYNVFKNMVKAQGLLSGKPVFDHLVGAGTFNVRSSQHMKRWLFDVKKYTPIKSTARKEQGMPSMDWSKVMELEPARRAEFQPSADKQTIEILAVQHSDKLLHMVLRLNSLTTMCNWLLKKGQTNEDGEVEREAGMMFFVASDGRVHGMHSATETGRPRSWKPNSLNWPSWINKLVEGGIVDVLLADKQNDELPPEFEKYLKWDEVKSEWKAAVPSIRSCVEAPADWCLVESDYQTAEVRGLAYISEDEDLINSIIKPDPCFARVKPEFKVDDDCVCRLSFPERLAGVPDDLKNRLAMTYTVDGVQLAKFTEDQLLRDSNGEIVCGKADLHWLLAEIVHKKPREILIKKKDRNASKIGRFSSVYGASPDTIERKIESDLGVKPEPETGQGILDALAESQPRATEFLEQVAKAPVSPGYLRAASGRIRHFHTHPEHVPGLSGRQQKSVAGAQGREARNFFMQESVAATAAIAGFELLAFGMKHGLKGSPMTILYDSVVTLCPVEEREIWMKAHELCMFRAVGWAYGDRILKYPIDTELNTGWSAKPSKDMKNKLHDMSWQPVSEQHKYLLDELNLALDKHKADDKLGVRNKRDLP